MMAAMNRIGSKWVGAHTGLMTDTLRGEWGFDGVVETDQASFDVFSYEDLREGLASGTDLWLNTDANLWKLDDGQMTPSVQQGIVTAAHNIAYAIVNSNAMNGLSAGGELVHVTPLWMWGLYGADVLFVLIAALLVFFSTRTLLRHRKNRAQATA
jgi:beta-glucosidase